MMSGHFLSLYLRLRFLALPVFPSFLVHFILWMVFSIIVMTYRLYFPSYSSPHLSLLSKNKSSHDMELYGMKYNFVKRNGNSNRQEDWGIGGHLQRRNGVIASPLLKNAHANTQTHISGISPSGMHWQERVLVPPVGDRLPWLFLSLFFFFLFFVSY